ncbi:protein PBDC1-like [Anneissia japonica]|uniref:protein PBDC1-like n=1 Tax=Anneissia japonica TaxID=1529436 RepID=UPI0014254CB4|nr:protein PBDC1-like [Anneissia japonica]
MQWAMKAFKHAEVYYNLISSVDSRSLKLTKHDDEILEHFNKDFPDFNIQKFDEDDLKTESAKFKWRPFCNHFDGTVEDFNFGTLLRLDCSKDYSEENSTLATRIQFYAIEIARNRAGLNLVNRKKGERKENDKESKVNDKS